MYYFDEIRNAGSLYETADHNWFVTAPCGCLWAVTGDYNGVHGCHYEPCDKHDPEQGCAKHPVEIVYDLYGGPMRKTD